MLKEASEYLQLPPGQCIMVGDRLETDMLMGIEAGMHTALVLTGVTSREEAAISAIKPEFILESLSKLLEIT